MVINTLLALGAILSYIDVLSALQGSSLLFLQIVPIPPVHRIIALHYNCKYVQHLQVEECLEEAGENTEEKGAVFLRMTVMQEFCDLEQILSKTISPHAPLMILV